MPGPDPDASLADARAERGKPGVFFVKVMRLADCLTDEAEIR
ncbi:hypothetical protein ACOZ4Y_00385 [Komagataeibacter rhaeticus]|nr:hypothetical protein [Komagataeibacter rhaeticus]